MKLSSQEAQVLNNIDEQHLVSMLGDLIRIPSQNPPGEEQRIAKYCAQRCRKIGMDVQLLAQEDERNTVIATLSGTKDRPVLLYHAHLDTVPIGDRSRWKFDPLEGHIKNRRIYGRGACDTKNNVASMIHVAEALVRARVSVKGKLVLCFAADEETGGHHGTEYVLNQGYLKDVDMVIAGEQTELKVAIAEKGMANLLIRTKGVSAHASRVTDKGINAISKMGKILCAIDEIYLPKLKQRKHRLLGIPTCNFGVIEGGTKSNMVAEHCCLHLDCRLLPGQRAEDISKEIEGLIERLHQEDSHLDATVELRSESPSFEMEENAPLVQQLRKAIEKVKGVDLGITGYYPVSDGRFFAYRHIPTVVFGSGSSLQAHTTDEYVEIDQVIDSAKILALLALNVVC